jgi:hypothetical protein
MNPEGIKPKSIEEVKELLRWAVSSHLEDDELAMYYDGVVSEVTRARIKAHLRKCKMCSERLKSLREGMREYYKPIIKSLFKILPQFLTQWARERGLQFAFAAGAKEAPIKAEGEVLNGALWWDISEDGTGNLSVKLGSFILELEGTVLEVGIGKLSKQAVLKRVPGAEDQVGAEVVFTPEEREGIAPDAELWIEVVETPQSLKGE